MRLSRMPSTGQGTPILGTAVVGERVELSAAGIEHLRRQVVEQVAAY